ncbi:MAG: TIGR02452 family protein [Tyzzerella sp.]|nr:TIGR02452 family protein [Tyzzerella sp.]
MFQDTERMCEENGKLKAAIRKSISHQKLILENDAISEIDKKRYEEPAQVIVSKKRSYEAASAYKNQNVCVHNFASASNPGGGVTHGASAQEECLCRCSDLYFCLNTPKMWNGFYKPHRIAKNPIHNDDIIYTPDVVVFKTDTASPQLMEESDWYNVNVLTCAAPNLRERPSNMFNSGDGDKCIKISDDELMEIHEKRLGRILDIAANEKNDVVILGAFGCGAFSNNPTVVAKAAKNVIEEYKYTFKTIEFAVYCSPRDERNYTIFKKTFS